MPKWLEGNLGPTVALWLLAFVWGGLSAVPEEAGRRAGVPANFALSLIIASWVMADARKRGRALPYDFDNLLFFAWPVILPIYLLQTRKLRILLTLLFFIGVCLFAWAGAFLVALLSDVEMD
ncbi:MAG TPA: hypothetical protein VJ063_11345 [Verrucomicrobiae bacterium]|nr:hypothetical protein [Verrucomicrobiae bacterium]